MHWARGGSGRYTNSSPQLLFDRGGINRRRPFDKRLHNIYCWSAADAQADLLFGVRITVSNCDHRRPI